MIPRRPSRQPTQPTQPTSTAPETLRKQHSYTLHTVSRTSTKKNSSEFKGDNDASNGKRSSERPSSRTHPCITQDKHCLSNIHHRKRGLKRSTLCFSVKLVSGRVPLSTSLPGRRSHKSHRTSTAARCNTSVTISPLITWISLYLIPSASRNPRWESMAT